MPGRDHPLALWRVFVVGAVLSAPLTAANAQMHLAWDANAGVSRIVSAEIPAQLVTAVSTGYASNSKWLGLSATGATFRFNRSYGEIRADGLVRAGNAGTETSGGLNVLMATPSWNGIRLTGSWDAKRLPDGEGAKVRDSTALDLRALTKSIPNWQATTSARVSFNYYNNGWWIGADSRRGAAVGDSVSATKVVLGYSRQIGDARLGLSLGSQAARYGGHPVIFTKGPIKTAGDSLSDTVRIGTFGDSAVAPSVHRWSEVAAHFGWSRGRIAFDAIINARPRVGTLPSSVWGDGSGSAAITSRIAAIGTIRTSNPAPGLAISASRTFSLGIRVAPPALWRPDSPLPTHSVASAFGVQQTAPGEYLITIKLPSARTVEVAGDFTGWKAVPLRQLDNSRWEVAVHVSAGSHRCNIRIDGSEWVPPPHVTAINDEFNGRVGLIVVE